MTRMLARTRFNSRSREGSDGLSTSVYSAGSSVSIRAPARGATDAAKLATGIIAVSIRAPARGATFLLCADLALKLFQFALPRGERRIDPGFDRIPGKFQFALPRGERLRLLPAKLGAHHVSIRAPARGATAIIGWQVLSGISQRRALACQQGTGG